MINFKYKVTQPKVIERIPELENIDNKVIVKPKFLSICAADLRYYFGWRDQKILEKKYPISLIHEGVGEVVWDESKTFNKGDKVILIPNQNSIVNYSNYLETTNFSSSSVDGFMQEVVLSNKENLLKIENQSLDLISYSLCELTSVAFQAIRSLKKSIKENHVIGLWGDGSLSYILQVCLKELYPKNKILVFGKHKEKMNIFNSSCQKIEINNVDKNSHKVDIAFECVGGESSEKAINQIIDVINPLGKIVLLGVSENPININTRTILEKGIALVGRSRSDYTDFKDALNLMSTKSAKDLDRVISIVQKVNNISDMKRTFDESLNQSHKTIMEWNV